MPFRFVDEIQSENTADNTKIPSNKYRFVKDEPSKIRSVLSAAPKGFIKELRDQLTKTPIIGSGIKELQEKTPTLAKSDEDIEQLIQEFLPTQEGFIEKSLERGGKIAPYALTGGGNVAGQVLRSALAGFLGQGAEEAGLPPWAQGLIELPAFSAPGLGKKIIPTKGQKEIVEGARGLGLTEQEITPLIQSEKKQKFLTKAAPRRGRTKKLLDKSYQALGNVYDRLKTSSLATKELSPEASEKVLGSIESAMKEFPSDIRNVIKEDLSDLMNGPITGASLTNFFKDINHYLGKGHKQLGQLKEPLFKAFEDISPEFAQEFRLTNKLYSKYSDIAGKMKPTLVSDLYSAGEAIRLLTGLSLGNLPVLTEIVGEHSARILARELLLNPRLQNISKKMMTALNQNKFSAANQFLKSYTKELQESDPEIAQQLEGIDFTDLKKAESNR